MYVLKKLPNCFPLWLYHFEFSLAVYESSSCSCPCQHQVVSVFKFLAIVVILKWYIIVLFSPPLSNHQFSSFTCYSNVLSFFFFFEPVLVLASASLDMLSFSSLNIFITAYLKFLSSKYQHLGFLMDMF